MSCKNAKNQLFLYTRAEFFSFFCAVFFSVWLEVIFASIILLGHHTEHISTNIFEYFQVIKFNFRKIFQDLFILTSEIAFIEDFMISQLFKNQKSPTTLADSN